MKEGFPLSRDAAGILYLTDFVRTCECLISNAVISLEAACVTDLARRGCFPPILEAKDDAEGEILNGAERQRDKDKERRKEKERKREEERRRQEGKRQEHAKTSEVCLS